MTDATKQGCLDRYCNGPKICVELVPDTTLSDEYLCDSEWCEFHPNYKP